MKRKQCEKSYKGMFKPISKCRSFGQILVSLLDDLFDKSEMERKYTDLLKVGQ